MLPLSISVETISNLVVLPSIGFEKLKAGTSELLELNLYCSVLIPFTMSFLTGRPNVPLTGSALFITLINCSYQSGLEGSFHRIVWFSRFILLLSNNVSDVLTLSIFNNPFAAWLRLGL